jgi:hypothetical protein
MTKFLVCKLEAFSGGLEALSGGLEVLYGGPRKCSIKKSNFSFICKFVQLMLT